MTPFMHSSSAAFNSRNYDGYRRKSFNPVLHHSKLTTTEFLENSLDKASWTMTSKINPLSGRYISKYDAKAHVFGRVMQKLSFPTATKN